MEYVRLSELNLREYINRKVFVSFIVRDVSVRLQKDKFTKFISFNMVDKDKIVDVKLFGAKQSQIDMIQNGKTFNAAIDVQEYDRGKDGISCIVYNIEPSKLQPEYFADWSNHMVESKRSIENTLGEIINTTYGQIAYPILIKNWDKFYVWAGGKSQHHTKLGDLMTHTAEVIRICDELADMFNSIYGEGFVNRALLLSSALLHDIGKVTELDVDAISGNVEYSTESSLSTHLMNILSEIDKQSYLLQLGEQVYEINEVNEEEGIKTNEQLAEEKEVVYLLKHSIGAHHGKLEWGSTILASTPEAYILSKADEISAEMYKFNSAFNSLVPGKSISTWSNGGVKTIYKELGK